MVSLLMKATGKFYIQGLLLYQCSFGAMTGPWPTLSEYVQAHRACSGPTSGKRHQPIVIKLSRGH